MDRIKAERKKAKHNRNKYTAVASSSSGFSGGGGAGTGTGSGSRYGGFGSDSAYSGAGGTGYSAGGGGTGGYGGGGYGGGFDDEFSDNYSKGKYDDDGSFEDDHSSDQSKKQTQNSDTSSVVSPTITKQSAKEINLFDFDEPTATTTARAQPASHLADDEEWGTFSSGGVANGKVLTRLIIL